MNENTIKDWLESHECISPRKVERAAGLPTKTISHYVTGRRSLSPEHTEAVVAVLKNYGFNPKKR